MKLEPEAFVFEQKKGKPDYECSKPNFYCNSIILLLITDSFSLCSWSKTSLIHYSCPPLKRRRNWQGYLLCLIYGGYFFLLWWLTANVSGKLVMFKSVHLKSLVICQTSQVILAVEEDKKTANLNWSFFLSVLISVTEGMKCVFVLILFYRKTNIHKVRWDLMHIDYSRDPRIESGEKSPIKEFPFSINCTFKQLTNTTHAHPWIGSEYC